MFVLAVDSFKAGSYFSGMKILAKHFQLAIKYDMLPRFLSGDRSIMFEARVQGEEKAMEEIESYLRSKDNLIARKYITELYIMRKIGNEVAKVIDGSGVVKEVASELC